MYYLMEGLIDYVSEWSSKNDHHLLISLLSEFKSEMGKAYDCFCQIGIILFKECFYSNDEKLIRNTIYWLKEAKYMYENKIENTDDLYGIYYKDINSQFCYYQVLYLLYMALMPTPLIYGFPYIEKEDLISFKKYIPFEEELALECLLKSRNMNCATFSCHFNLTYFYYANHKYEEALETLNISLVNISEYDLRMYKDLIEELKENIEKNI